MQLTGLNGASSAFRSVVRDSSSIYFVDGKGALIVVPAKGGAVTVIAPTALLRHRSHRRRSPGVHPRRQDRGPDLRFGQER